MGLLILHLAIPGLNLLCLLGLLCLESLSGFFEFITDEGLTGAWTHTCSDLVLFSLSGHFYSHQLGKNLSVALLRDLGDVVYLGVLEEKAARGKAGQHNHDLNQYMFIHFTLHY